MVNRISPEEAARLVDAGAALVDIREEAERASGVIPGARHAPLSALESAELGAGRPLIFHCRSGRRTADNAEALKQKAGGGEVHILEGGIDAWRAAGLPLQRPE